ncbi:MAG: ribosome small subunit-dependent GTPase A [Fibrobacteria bacterium]|nr:ribosome small subunit-dependent GTPase A [Fibrobacteria bacterium]
MSAPEEDLDGRSGGRRQSRARRVDAAVMWREGFSEEPHSGVKRRRDLRGTGAKVRVDKLPDTVGALREGLVVSVSRRTAEVEFLDEPDLGAVVDVAYSPRLELGKESLVAVGDRVDVHGLPGSGWLLTKVHERRTRLSRPGPDARDHLDIVVAANIEVLVIVVSADKPRFHPRFVDRFLVTAQLGGVRTVLFLNKCDLLPPEERPDLSTYERLGVQVVRGSASAGTGIEELRQVVSGKWSAFAGNSGVGKSTLIASLCPGQQIATGEVRSKDGRGRHTTTRAKVYPLPDGGRIVDTPGIRELALHRLTPSEVGLYFTEFEPLFGTCRFNDCMHTHEPGCAVRSAVAAGTIHPDRYASYVRILETLNR